MKFCGECYKYNPDFPIEVDCVDCVANMSDYGVARDGMKMKESTLTAVISWPTTMVAGCEVSFASKMSSPKVEDLVEAGNKRMSYRPGLQFTQEDLAAASFANLGNHGSQRFTGWELQREV